MFPMVNPQKIMRRRTRVLPDLSDVGTNDVIDWKRIFAPSKPAAIAHDVVEHDVAKVPLDSLKTSDEYLRRLQF